MTGTSPKVVILDYGSGNLRSAQRALQRVGSLVGGHLDIGADPQTLASQLIESLRPIQPL